MKTSLDAFGRKIVVHTKYRTKKAIVSITNLHKEKRFDLRNRGKDASPKEGWSGDWREMEYKIRVGIVEAVKDPIFPDERTRCKKSP